MTTYILRRLLSLLPVLFIVSVVVFWIIHLTPGDPASAILGEEASSEDIRQLRERMGLNDPLPVQFVDWLSRVIRLDLGDSLFLPQSVTEALLSRAQPTGLLSLYAMTMAIVISVPLGVLAAVKRNSLVDRLLMVVALIGVAVPNFFLGILLILLFAVVFHWLPSGGYVEITQDPIAHFKAMILPAFAIGFSQAALLARVVRSSMLDVLSRDYVQTARAKGLSGHAVVGTHALRNALIPAVTVAGTSLGALLNGAIVVETVFTIPGMGLLVAQAILRRDYPVIQGTVMVIAVIYVLVNLLVDILYVFLDPRIRYGDR